MMVLPSNLAATLHDKNANWAFKERMDELYFEGLNEENEVIKNIKKESLIFLFEHYKKLIQSEFIALQTDIPQTNPSHLLFLCQEAIDNYDKFYELDGDNSKVNRWLGFIQGILISKSITTVEKERNFTRPYLTKHRES